MTIQSKCRLPMQPCSQANKTVQANRLKENNLSFQELLHQEFRRQQEVKLSAHAAQRLREREIVLTEQDFSKINQAVQRAAAKGARDSLVLYGDLALIASVANRTIITAVDSKNMAEHVFTNIDSAVIVK